MVSNIITKTNGRNKVVDFRNGLVLANPDDYAAMHGAGGKEHAANSVIKIGLCDYSAGTGSKSKTVFANITPEVCEELLEVCKGNIGTTIIDSAVQPLAEQRAVNRKLSKTADMLICVLDKGLGVVTKAVESADAGKPPAGYLVAKGLCQRLTKVRDAVMAQQGETSPTEPMRVDCHKDISYTQDRIHSQRTGPDGFAPVQRLNIFHTTYRNKTGELNRYPWTIKITNGEAKVQVQSSGATSFSTASMRNVDEAFIQVSDADMYRMMSRVVRFISTWEVAMCSTLIREGELQREKERKEFYHSQTDGLRPDPESGT